MRPRFACNGTRSMIKLFAQVRSLHLVILTSAYHVRLFQDYMQCEVNTRMVSYPSSTFHYVSTLPYFSRTWASEPRLPALQSTYCTSLSPAAMHLAFEEGMSEEKTYLLSPSVGLQGIYLASATAEGLVDLRNGYDTRSRMQMRNVMAHLYRVAKARLFSLGLAPV